ncbi:MAG TPA: hypothetical protein VM240_03335 [Verrucomicrobiae bacterium]|nr:hypothetical protein [Verrucomicrobiae bacterium]
MRVPTPSLLPLLLCAVLAACDHEQDAEVSAPKDADISILSMGNSHQSVNDIQAMIADMVRSERDGELVAIVEAPGWMFLEDRLYHEPSLRLLREIDWSYVILQAQKYSTSGQYSYSTAEAKELIRLARVQHAVPILFPEWPRLGVDETQRIYDLHVSIAQAEPACVAPIGQAWDLSLARHPDLRLHAPDGNHSNHAGAFLAALVLHATITGGSPLDVPHLAAYPVETEDQARLRQVAADTVADWPPRAWCPDDPYAPPAEPAPPT